MRLILTLIISVLSSSALAQSDQAPLGLKWGLSQAEITALGAEFREEKEDSYGKGVVFTKLPQVIADAEIVLGSFGYNDRLYRIVIISKSFANDPFGSSVLSRYNSLSSLLSEKYGKPTVNHRLGDSIYAEPRYFLSGVNNGRTSWYTNFKTPEIFVQLGLFAEDGSSGRWKIIYENAVIKKDFDKTKQSKEKNAL